MNRRPRRSTSAARRLHRWLGIGSLVFLLLLSVTGIALNHSGDLGLDERYTASPWLLDWYGIETPQPGPSFDSAYGRVTLLGERLYLGDREVAAGVAAVVGAVEWREQLVVGTADALLFFTAEGVLSQHVDLIAAAIPVEALGVGAAAGVVDELVVAARGRRFAYGDVRTGWQPSQGAAAGVRWSEPSALPQAELDSIARRYRGPGVSWARLLADVHSGRLFSQAGPIVMDAAGLLFVVLGVTGLILWLRSPRRNG